MEFTQLKISLLGLFFLPNFEFIVFIFTVPRFGLCYCLGILAVQRLDERQVEAEFLITYFPAQYLHPHPFFLSLTKVEGYFDKFKQTWSNITHLYAD